MKRKGWRRCRPRKQQRTGELGTSSTTSMSSTRWSRPTSMALRMTPIKHGWTWPLGWIMQILMGRGCSCLMEETSFKWARATLWWCMWNHAEPISIPTHGLGMSKALDAKTWGARDSRCASTMDGALSSCWRWATTRMTGGWVDNEIQT